MSETYAKREPAKRVFSAELRLCHHVIKGSDDKSPSYILLPTGGLMNRILISGVAISRDKMGDTNPMYRLKVSDKVGAFYVTAGQYQQNAMYQMIKLECPAYVTIVGKPSVYTTPDGKVLVSVRAESVTVTDKATRDNWLVDTARATMKRVAERDVSEAGKLAKQIHEEFQPEIINSWIEQAMASGDSV